MVEQNRSGSYTQILYGPSGSKLALMNGQTLKSAFVPLTAGATAVYTASGLGYYRHSDWLGSSRLASTTSNGIYYDGAYAPYGEPYAEIGTPDRSFTGQNQDTVSDTSASLYDFMFREYRPTFSRWIAPDPAGIAAVDSANPQSWNRYAYVVNNPLVYVDPLGLATGPPSPPHGIVDPPIWWSDPRCDVLYLDAQAVCLWTEYEVRNPAWAGPIGPHGGQAQNTRHCRDPLGLPVACPSGPPNPYTETCINSATEQMKEDINKAGKANTWKLVRPTLIAGGFAGIFSAISKNSPKEFASGAAEVIAPAAVMGLLADNSIDMGEVMGALINNYHQNIADCYAQPIKSH
jgi:RHS repeat-associated protein